MWSARERKTIRKTFPTLAAARAWRQQSQFSLRRGTMQTNSKATLAEAANAWLSAAEAGIVRTRSGARYKPSTLRGYKHALRAMVLPLLGQQRLAAITPAELQDFSDQLAQSGISASHIRNALTPLRTIFRRATALGELAVNPMLNVSSPTVTARRERLACPDEAAALIAAVPAEDRAIWAVAFYAGLRFAEIQALDWASLDFDRNLIRIERAWDRSSGFIEPKSRSGKRRVPMTDTLREHLLAQRERSNDGGFVFPNRRGTGPFYASSLYRRARAAWAEAKLEPLTLHDCRHIYASFMIAAGVNAKALSTYMGHSSITITLDLYGHLLPGNEREAAARLERWLHDNPNDTKQE